ncbi:hypothetical protein COS77_00685 [Candidatus Roizmanbacteria bacterium CG06_land_8_20_14_3_00_34_14]|uniref:Glycosyltransferase RgtA/B/C/D-like domain-containing protein n=2 Tax=Candidatus Roizmaniibacteriota TaxID=1752723 RepID=A0A2M7AVG4_9BACT|nr:MAG: hypothetical protein COT02_00570 [Candidatus Roizmanbacteria bacterium CG07_land_8_20_14_0_80_34_15]PIU74602.1 MAG: hypothetical protein COS77_00685 [Candidatus Roizmanbacteria bacterium CG06_land_8_20_14_3_00_34_14]
MNLNMKERGKKIVEIVKANKTEGVIKTAKVVWIFILIGLLVYGLSLFNGFVWDDEEQIVNNVFVHSVKNIPLLFQSSTFNTGGAGVSAGTYYRPLMMTFFSFVYQLFGPNPFFFHLFQLFFHILTAILVYLMFKHFFKEMTAFFMAIIFLVHPAGVESVAYISAVQDIFYVLFGILAFYIVIKNRAKFEFKNIFLINTLLFLSLLSKETAILFFIIIFIYQLIFDRKFIFENLIFFMMTVGIYALLRFALAGVFFTPYHNAPIVQLSLWQRIMMIPAIFFYYLKLFFYPLDLAVMQHWVIRTLDFRMLLGSLSAGILALLLWKKRFNRNFIFFFLWFIITIFPYLQIFPLDMTVAERWFYLPVVGLLGMMGAVWSKSGNKLVIMGVIIIAIFSIRSFFRTMDWKNGLTLYGRDIKISKGAFDLENNYGVELFRAGDYQEAKVHFLKSTELAPYWWTNWNNLGAVYEQEKNYQKASEYYQKSIDNGQYYLAYENMAKILVLQGKDNPIASGKTDEFLRKALEMFPENENLKQIKAYRER